MKRSTNRIITSHPGSVPRSPELFAAGQAVISGKSNDVASFKEKAYREMPEAIRKQAEAGIDVVSDGEYHGLGAFWKRIKGYGARQLKLGQDSVKAGTPRGEHALFPGFYKELPGGGGGGAPLGVSGPMSYMAHEEVMNDIAAFKSALNGVNVTEAFMCSVGPGWHVPGFGFREDVYEPHYKTEEEFMFALAEAMRPEYEAIANAGFILQVDEPRLLTGWDVPHPKENRHLTTEEYRKAAFLRVEALNHALRNIAADRIRYHACWGSWKGAHFTDIPLKDAVDILLKVKFECLSLEAATVGHANDWKVWKDHKFPAGKSFMPGVATHKTNAIETPDLIADRIVTYANLMGRENVIAGADCGWSNGRLHPELSWAKMKVTGEGAKIATAQLWRK